MVSAIPGILLNFGVPGYWTYLLGDELLLLVYVLIRRQILFNDKSRKQSFWWGGAVAGVGAVVTQLLVHLPFAQANQLKSLLQMGQSTRLAHAVLKIQDGVPLTVMHIISGVAVFGLISLVVYPRPSAGHFSV